MSDNAMNSRDGSPRSSDASLLPANYRSVLEELKARVRASQAKAARAVNRELITLYLDIGRRLAEQDTSWGTKVVERLAKDLKAAFPEMRGFSRTNLFYMRQVYQAWTDADESVQQLVGQIPWGHHLVLVSKLGDPAARAWYPKNRLMVEYALRDLSKPIGVAEWETRIVASLPKELKGSLPTVEELEAELSGRPEGGDGGERRSCASWSRRSGTAEGGRSPSPATRWLPSGAVLIPRPAAPTAAP